MTVSVKALQPARKAEEYHKAYMKKARRGLYSQIFPASSQPQAEGLLFVNCHETVRVGTAFL